MQNEPVKKNKIIWIERIRTIAIIAVITIHTDYSAIVQFSESMSNRDMIAYRSLMNCMWWGVPCFLMISGYLLLNPEKVITYKQLFKQYVLRMLLVLFSFGTVFAWMETVFQEHKVSIIQIWTAVSNVLQGKSWAHLWYLYCLIGLYLMLPIYKVVSLYMTDMDLKYFLCLNIIFLSILPLLKLINAEAGFSIPVAVIYPFWFFAGLAFRRNLFTWSRRKNALLLLLSSFILIICTYVRYRFDVDSMSFLFDYASILVVVQAISLFGLLKDLPWKLPQPINAISSGIADKSFGIYIVHMVFVNVFYKVLRLNPFDHSFGGVMVFLLVVLGLILSYFTVCILRKIPFVKKIV